MHTTTRTLNRWLLALIPLVLLAALVCWIWPRPREAFYSLYRERGKEKALETLDGYHYRNSDHFELYYTNRDSNVVDMVLQTAESVYEPVVKQMGFEPAGRVPLILYSSRDDLRHAFGWGNGESAVGVYWSGTIRLLSPNVWINEDSLSQKQKAYRQLNPIAHEFTHYVLDYMTNGNYPRWFTEGLAQWVEHRVTGYLWIEPESTLRQELYTLDDLQDRFDTLRNQPLAYRESYLLVDYFARTYGERSLSQLVQCLEDGTGFARAVQQVSGSSPDQVYDGWSDWVQAHLRDLDAAS
jgi:hypothetical protein